MTPLKWTHIPTKTEFTFLDHCTVGVGFPFALHSKDTGPPFLVTTCPLGGRICILGGTENEIYQIIKEN